MVKVVPVAHCPIVGVNVYNVVVVLFKAGDQLPVIPSFEIVGNGAKALPEQIGLTAVKVETIDGRIVTEVVATTAAHPALAAMV